MLQYLKRNSKHRPGISMRAAVAIIAVAAAALCAYARTAAEYFADAPDNLVPLLTRTARLDMLDYYNAGVPTPSRNIYGGSARIVAMTPTTVDVQLSRDASMQLALVPVGKDTLVALTHTVLTPLPDSGITFYTKEWKPAATPAMPTATDFVAPELRKTASTLEMPDMIFIRAEYDPQRRLFVFNNTTRGYYTLHDIPDGLNFMRTQIEMTFDGKRFKPLKE